MKICNLLTNIKQQNAYLSLSNVNKNLTLRNAVLQQMQAILIYNLLLILL